MDRELTYQMPFERLVRFSRFAARSAYRTSSFARWLNIGYLCSALVLLILFDRAIESWQDSVGLPWFSVFVALAAVYVGVILVLRRFALREMKSRVDYDSVITLRQDDSGLHFATDRVEHYLKWPGISQILVERDAVAVFSGNLFFLIPTRAFAGLQDRDEFVREVFGRLGDEAKARSKEHVGSVLAKTAEN